MLLQVDKLKTHFHVSDTRWAQAVDGVSFSIDEGETLALVGESGCGKSATAFSLMGLLPENASHPDGRILFDGQNLLELGETQMQELRGNRLGMIFQEPMTSLNPLMRIEKQLAEPLLRHRGMSRREARDEALKLLRHVGIPAPEERLRDYPHQLSGGMKQRVMIAMALACRPRLLIADEPTTALDVTIQAQILGLMKDLQAETGMAILFITHDLGVVNQMADRVCVMYAGQIVEQGDKRQVFENPSHPYTQGLFASIPRGARAAGQLMTIPGSVPAATDYPEGCRFQPRCPMAQAKCRQGDVPSQALKSGHEAACHFLSAAVANPPFRRHEPNLTAASTPTETAEPLIRVENLKTHFPVCRGILRRPVAQVKAVDDVSFDLRRGSTLALVGESGCGKTTIGQSMLRLLREASGRVVYCGENVMQWERERLRQMRKQLQMVFQDPFSSLSPRLTVGRIVGEGLTVHSPHMSAEERRQAVAKALQEVGLDEAVGERYPHEFSGGQRQRISIARALVLQPDFLVLDEPTSALDVSVQAQILNLLLELQAKHGLTYLFITHNLAVVEYVADFVAVMYLGRIVEYAACADLFRNPRHPYTRSLLKSVPQVDVEQELIRLTGEVPSPMNPPRGCHFHPRCPVFAAAAPDSDLRNNCPREYPELLDDAGHSTACHACAGEK
jgi:peptide/nickel transport system ATP-binding protein